LQKKNPKFAQEASSQKRHSWHLGNGRTASAVTHHVDLMIDTAEQLESHPF
jgi:hypothetical protein